MKKLLLFLLLTSSVMIGCHAQKKGIEASESKEIIAPADKKTAVQSDTLFYVRRTPCFGRCPVYEFLVKTNGESVFTGIRHTRLIGIFTRTYTAAEVDEAKERFLQANFMELNDTYTSPIKDQPTIITIYKSGPLRKQVNDYYGAPKALKDLEAYLQEIAFSEGWTGGENK
jgi:hypothetical protein